MRTAFAFLLVVSLGSGDLKAAERRYAKPTILPSRAIDSTTLFRQATAARIAITSEYTGPGFVIGVVGSTAGSGGTYFKSEVTFINGLTRAQDILVFFFPAGAGICSGGPSVVMHLEAGTLYGWEDFIDEVFAARGLGSLVVFAVDPAGNFDPTARIDGYSRIWTPVPGFRGTGSQDFPGVPFSAYPNAQSAYGLRHETGLFRTNVAIFNYLPSQPTGARVFDVVITGELASTSYEMSVPPCSMILQGIPSGNYGPLAVSIRPRDADGGWYGFASSVDNMSQDSWTSTARPDR